jgi:hypothetical protein
MNIARPVEPAEYHNPYMYVENDQPIVFMSPETNTDGTGLRGYIHLRYDQLKQIFGDYNSRGDRYKVDYEWVGTIDDQPFTIYNWKNGPGYFDDKPELGARPEEITMWHIGARTATAYNAVCDYIDRRLGVCK